jgi:hypothetical protein
MKGGICMAYGMTIKSQVFLYNISDTKIQNYTIAKEESISIVTYEHRCQSGNMFYYMDMDVLPEIKTLIFSMFH